MTPAGKVTLTMAIAALVVSAFAWAYQYARGDQ